MDNREKYKHVHDLVHDIDYDFVDVDVFKNCQNCVNYGSRNECMVDNLSRRDMYVYCEDYLDKNSRYDLVIEHCRY